MLELPEVFWVVCQVPALEKLREELEQRLQNVGGNLVVHSQTAPVPTALRHNFAGYLIRVRSCQHFNSQPG